MKMFYCALGGVRERRYEVILLLFCVAVAAAALLAATGTVLGFIGAAGFSLIALGIVFWDIQNRKLF